MVAPKKVVGMAQQWAKKVMDLDELAAIDEYTNSWNVPPKWKLYADPKYGNRKIDGDEKVKKMREGFAILEASGFTRSKHQKKIHEAFLQATLRVIYKNDF